MKQVSVIAFLIAMATPLAAATATRIAVVGLPAETTLGVPFDVTVSALDDNQTVDTTYSGTVMVSGVADPYTFTLADAGRHTFQVTSLGCGYVSITAVQVDKPSTSTTGSTHTTRADLSVTIDNSGPACDGQVVTLIANPSEPDVTYLWLWPPPYFEESTNRMLHTTSSGSYHVMIFDRKGCQAEAFSSVVHFNDAVPTLSAAVCPRPDSTFDVSITNPPFTNIRWSASSATLVAGQGTLTATFAVPSAIPGQTFNVLAETTRAASGCTGSRLISFPLLPSDAVGLEPACPNQSASADLGIGDNVQWSVTNGTVTSATNQRHIEFIAGSSGYVTLTAQYTVPGLVCPPTRNFVVPILSDSATRITTVPSLCPGQTNVAASAPALIGANRVRYEWTVNNGTLRSGQGTRAITYDAGTSGAVQLLVNAGPHLDCGISGVFVPIGNPTVHFDPVRNICRGEEATISATLAGTPPFTVRWADGVEQTTPSTTISRTVNPRVTTTYAITSVSGALCGGAVDAPVTVFVRSAPTATFPSDTTVTAGSPATLTAVASGTTFRYEWFEGETGDTSRPVGTDATLTTPPLQQTTKYWSRVSNNCGAIKSPTITVAVRRDGARRRAAGH
jgi:hypothetical protein